MKFIAVRGKGNPNEEDGAYKEAIGLLYGIAFTIKMSKMGDYKIFLLETGLEHVYTLIITKENDKSS